MAHRSPPTAENVYREHRERSALLSSVSVSCSSRSSSRRRFQANSIEMALRDLAELRLACLQALGFELRDNDD